MRAIIVVLVFFVVSTNAQSSGSFVDNLKGFFSDLGNKLSSLGHSFADTFKALGQTTVQTGSTLLTQALGQAVNVASQGAGEFVGQLIHPHPVTTAAPSRRALSDELIGRLTTFLGNCKQELENVLTSGVHKLESISKKVLKHPLGQIVTEVDDIVSSHGEALTTLAQHLEPRVRMLLQKSSPHDLDLLAKKLSSEFMPAVEQINQELQHLGSELKQKAGQLLSHPTTQAMLKLLED